MPASSTRPVSSMPVSSDQPIAKGRIAKIDISEAMRVGGVIAVLTHENRPPMAETDKAYKDDLAPGQGSPFRPLYNDKIMFSRQPVALVLAENSETARFAASLVRVEYEREAHVTDMYSKLDDAIAVKEPAKPRGDAAKALADSDVRHHGEYYVPIEHHNPMEPYASTVTGTAAARSRSTIKRKACRTCTAMCAASSI